MAENTVNLLLVEDDDVAAEGIERAFRKAKIGNPIHRATDGIDALELLRGEGGRERLPRPYMILLDLKMPRMDGQKFLEEIRGDAELDDSVIFVLTTSSDEQDRVAAYKKYVAGYIVKSKAGEDFVELLGMLDHFWRVVELPEK